MLSLVLPSDLLHINAQKVFDVLGNTLHLEFHQITSFFWLSVVLFNFVCAFLLIVGWHETESQGYKLKSTINIFVSAGVPPFPVYISLFRDIYSPRHRSPTCNAASHTTMPDSVLVGLC